MDQTLQGSTKIRQTSFAFPTVASATLALLAAALVCAQNGCYRGQRLWAAAWAVVVRLAAQGAALVKEP